MSKDWVEEAEAKAAAKDKPADSANAEVSDWDKAMADPIDTGMAAIAGLAKGIPGGEYLQAKLGGLLGVPQQEMAKEQAALAERHPVVSGVGAMGGAAALAAALPGSGVANAAAQAAVLTPAYKLGEMANQAQLQASPLHVEQIAHAFDLEDILISSGLTALLGAPGLALHGLSGAGKAAANQSVKSAGGLFTKAAAKLGVSESELGKIALEKGLLKNEAATQAAMRRAGKDMAAAAKKLQVTTPFQESLATEMKTLVQGVEHNAALDGTVKDVLKQAERIETGTRLDGPQLHDIILGLKAEARAAGKNNFQKKQLLDDVAHRMEDMFSSELRVSDATAADIFDAAKHDYRVYATMSKEARAGANKQLTEKDLVKAAGTEALAHVAGGALGGPAGALFADVAVGGNSVRQLAKKNPAVLLDKISKAAPGQQFITKTDEALSKLLKPSMAAELVTREDVDEKFNQLTHMLETSAGNPDAYSTKLRQELDFLPPIHADAVTANTMNKLQSAASEIPRSRGPATAFGIQTQVSDREKREYLRKVEDKFDVYGAIASGRRDRILEAEKYNPEMVRAVRARLVEKLSTMKDVDYLTKRRVLGILGVAGTPTQDPALGARLQTVIQTRKAAQDAQGQMKSARQANATLKNNSATLTRAQKILNSGE